MVAVYTDSTYLTEAHRKHVFPLLFYLHYYQHKTLLEHFTLVASIAYADVCIVPVTVEYYYKKGKLEELETFINTARNAGKAVWVYSYGDAGFTLPYDVITFRLGGFRQQTTQENTRILPAYTIDPYTVLQLQFKPLSKTTTPMIGFVGHAAHGIQKWVKEWLTHQRNAMKRLLGKEFSDAQTFYPSSIKRYQLLKALENAVGIQTNFIYRSQYRAGAKSEAEKQKSALQFYQNIHESPYTFCMRGAGNFSVRLYETLAMGRIPVLIDTDCRLPLEEVIDWNQHILKTTAKTLVNDLIAFHHAVSEEDFKKMQINNRTLWLDTLRGDTFFEAIAKNLQYEN